MAAVAVVAEHQTFDHDGSLSERKSGVQQPSELAVAPPSAPACRADEVLADVFLTGAAGGHGYRSVRFTNRSYETCSLRGRPRATALYRGSPVADARTGHTYIYDPYPPHDLRHGDSAVVIIEFDPTDCDAYHGPLTPAQPTDTVAFHLRAGPLLVPMSLEVRCGFGVTLFGSATRT
jgi:hypothetical protein